MEGGSFFPQYFNEMLELIKFFKTNLGKTLIPFNQMQEEGKEETTESCFAYLVHFYIKYFMKYERDKEIAMQ